MGFGSDAQTMATRLIEYFGDSFTVTLKRTTTVIDPDTGDPTTTVVSDTATACFVSISEAFLDSQSLQIGDLELFVEADLDFVPDTKTVVIASGTSYKVIEHIAVQPGSTAAYYQLLVRQV